MAQSSAAPQQEENDQQGNRHSYQPQQSPAYFATLGFAFLFWCIHDLGCGLLVSECSLRLPCHLRVRGHHGVKTHYICRWSFTHPEETSVAWDLPSCRMHMGIAGCNQFAEPTHESDRNRAPNLCLKRSSRSYQKAAGSGTALAKGNGNRAGISGATATRP